MSDIAIKLLRKITKGDIPNRVLRTACDFRVEGNQFSFRLVGNILQEDMEDIKVLQGSSL